MMVRHLDGHTDIQNISVHIQASQLVAEGLREVAGRIGHRGEETLGKGRSNTENKISCFGCESRPICATRSNGTLRKETCLGDHRSH